MKLASYLFQIIRLACFAKQEFDKPLQPLEPPDLLNILNPAYGQASS